MAMVSLPRFTATVYAGLINGGKLINPTLIRSENNKKGTTITKEKTLVKK